MFNRICIFIALTINSFSIFSQTPDQKNLPVIDYSEPKEYIIAGVEASGVQYLDKKVLVSMSGLVVGRKIMVPGDEITKIVDKFWSQGLFSDVKVVASQIKGDSIWLDIRLKERPRLTEFTIKGVKKGDVDDLKEKIGLKPGAQVNDNVINNLKNIIYKFYKEKGFWNVKINVTQIPDTVSKNRVYLTADIRKGRKVKISSITFDGNQKFADGRLRRVLKKTKQKGGLNFFKSKKYVESNYKEDKTKLADFYAKNGYRDYMFLSDSIWMVSDSRIALRIKIHEGDQYHLRNIRWVGNTKYPDEVLNRVLMMKKGDVYDLIALDKRISSDEDAVHSMYLDNGYLFSSVEPVESKIENDSVDLEIHITEGRQASIKNIIITGNTKTNEHVVRRELDTYPGQLFSRSEIISSVRRLGQLGFFNPEKINPTPIPNPSDGTVDIKYSLEEKANDQLEISGGWGGNMLVGTLGLRFSNFSARNIFNPRAWRPVPSGDGQALSLRAQTNGSYYKAYSMSFTEPWFGGKKPNSFSFSLFYTIQNSASTSLLSTSNQNFKVSGASIGLGRRLQWPDRYFQLYNELSFQNYKLENWHGYFLFDNGSSKNLSFKIMLSRTSTDQTIYPRTGAVVTIGLQVTPPYSLFRKNNFWKLSPADSMGIATSEQNTSEYANASSSLKLGYIAGAVYEKEQANKYKWIEYHKWTYKGTWYYQIVKDLVLSFNTQFGYLGYFNKNLGYSPFEGFSLGGDGYTGYSLYGKETIGLRGYQNESVTPPTYALYYNHGQSSYSSTSVANIYSKVSLELRYPITLQPSATIFGLVFLEGGNSWTKFEEYNPFVMKRSAGVGIRAFLPMFGLLGIDWGYGFDNIPWAPNANKGNFHFVMGQQF
ncbi:MAG TPA: outer membrane protein assembly factor BamA [Bacteroidales bacterium]